MSAQHTKQGQSPRICRITPSELRPDSWRFEIKSGSQTIVAGGGFASADVARHEARESVCGPLKFVTETAP